MIITVIVLMIMMILIIKMNAQTRIMIFQINLENKIFPYSYYVFTCWAYLFKTANHFVL